MSTEWVDLHTLEAVSTAQKMKMEIEWKYPSENEEGWFAWTETSWNKNNFYRARDRKPIEKRYSIYLDGNSWCAIDANSFVNLQESTAGFGDTPTHALMALRTEETTNRASEKPKMVKVKSLCWLHKDTGQLHWRNDWIENESCRPYVRFPAGDIEGEVEA